MIVEEVVAELMLPFLLLFFLFEKFMNKILRVLYVFNVILLEFLNINYILPTP